MRTIDKIRLSSCVSQPLAVIEVARLGVLQQTQVALLGRLHFSLSFAGELYVRPADGTGRDCTPLVTTDGK